MADRGSYRSALLTGQFALFATALSQLAAVPLQITLAGVEGLGIVALATGWLGLAGTSVVWLTSGGMRRLGEARAVNDWDGYASARLVVRRGLAAFGLLLALVAIGAGLLFQQSVPPELRAHWLEALVFLSLGAFLQYEQAGATVELTVAKKQVVCNLATVVQNVMYLGVLWISTLAHPAGLASIFGSMAAGLVASRSILAMALRARESIPAVQGSWRSGLAALSRRRSVGYTAYGVLTLVQNSDTILVGWLGGAQAAGQFSLIWRIPTLIIQVLWRIPAYLEPYIIEAHAQGNSAQLSSWYVRGERWVLLLAGFAAVAFGLWGRPILELWVGEHAPVETWVYWAAAGGAFWLATARWPIGFMHAQARLRPLVRLLLVETGTRILLTIILFAYLGYAAPLLALNLVMVLGLFWGYRKLVLLDG